MAISAENILQQVVTWNMVDLAVFQNMACFVSTANTIMKNPQDFAGNLGASIAYEQPPQLVSQQGLVVNFEPIQQNSRTLTVNNQQNVSYSGTAEQIIFNNLEEYSKRLGDSSMQALASYVESDVASLCESIPYRFYGNGTTPISSAQQLAQAIANFRAYSAPPGGLKCYLDLQAVPAIVNSMQNQFTLERNNENSQSWMVGNWAGVDYYQSNLLKVHFSGSVANNGDTLTVVSTNDPTGNAISSITLSGASVFSDPNAIKKYDMAQFLAGSFFVTYQNSLATALPTQVLITSDAPSDISGNVTINVYPTLCATVGSIVQNINTNIVAGMQIKLLPDHKCGALVSDSAMYVAMPPLPSTYPFPSASATDPDTQVSVRLYYGVIPFQNVYGWTRDCVWGKDGVPQNFMRIAFPINTGSGIGF